LDFFFHFDFDFDLLFLNLNSLPCCCCCCSESEPRARGDLGLAPQSPAMALWWPLLVLAAAYALCRILLFLIPPTVPSIDVDASDGT
jgi:hypothetical protein